MRTATGTASRAFEVNFDGLVGPTHNYAGLSWGNIASQRHGGQVSNPKKAALEGLAKMKLLANLGIQQGVLPPHERPAIFALRGLGFTGKDREALTKAQREDQRLLEACSSASAMWAANAATVSPSMDTEDGRTHITPANLTGQFHRSLEPPTTERILQKIFYDEERFVVHEPLAVDTHFGDEGAANHIRLCRTHSEPGIEIFVYGRRARNPKAQMAKRFPARHTLEASQAVAHMHGLPTQATVFIQQNPDAIDAGVFHNDVISVGNENVLLYHEHAFVDAPRAIGYIGEAYGQYCDDTLTLIEIRTSQVSLDDAVASYFFNSQLVTLPDGHMSLICAIECLEVKSARDCIEEILDGDNPIQSVHHIDIRQSMKNGGGPGCLRLRVVLSEDELAALHQGVLLSNGLYDALCVWIEKHYRDKLHPRDLADPNLLYEGRAALDELTQILGLGSVYSFQGA